MATKVNNHDVSVSDAIIKIDEGVNRFTLALVQSGSAGTVTYTFTQRINGLDVPLEDTEGNQIIVSVAGDVSRGVSYEGVCAAGVTCVISGDTGTVNASFTYTQIQVKNGRS